VEPPSQPVIWLPPAASVPVPLYLDQRELNDAKPVCAAAVVGADRVEPLAFYQRLQRAGTAKKVARTTCMRKLLTILIAMLKQRTPWREVESHHAYIARQVLEPFSPLASMLGLVSPVRPPFPSGFRSRRYTSPRALLANAQSRGAPSTRGSLIDPR